MPWAYALEMVTHKKIFRERLTTISLTGFLIEIHACPGGEQGFRKIFADH
jgi:hypothetical protein